jgi:hypothetical protein
MGNSTRRGRWTLFFILLTSLVSTQIASAANFYVSPDGSDSNPGTLAQPFATIGRAQQALRQTPDRKEMNVFLRKGTYYLPAPLIFTPQDSGRKDAPVIYQAYQDEQPVISGGVRLALMWKPYRDGIMQATVPDTLTSDQLFVNGKRRPMARYPNFDPSAQYFDGFAPDAFSKERAARWADPAGGYMHTMHEALWGGFSYQITGKDANGDLTYVGGWQNNRSGAMHPLYRFVENIFEELDAPGEWFLNTKTHTLYFYPPDGLDLANATIEAVRLRNLIEFHGSYRTPVRFVTLKGLTFRHAARTFMDTKEPLLRTDWTIYRGGALFYTGTEDCTLEDSLLDQLGGNSVFISNYNRRMTIRGCHIVDGGANGIAFVGDPKAVRDGLIGYDQRQRFSTLDKTPGPKTDNYPANCLVDDCLIHHTGRAEKQTAAVEIDMAREITVRHCSIYDVPRAGINIGDGCWGGDVIEYCDVFDTVKETGDHGSFNSWGRDRYWGLVDVDMNTVTLNPTVDLPRLDAVKPNILRNSRWRCDHGWDIDLDDGSSNYEIRNNLCLHGGIKNREGFYRVVENNIMVNDSFCPHVWFNNSQDVFRHNIVFGPYKPAGSIAQPWGKIMDYNLVYKAGQTTPTPAIELQSQSGRDRHSIDADPLFVDPAADDYRVRAGSPALALGFVNFPMNQFGVLKPQLRAIARTPDLTGPGEANAKSTRDPAPHPWIGLKVRNIVGMGEMSAYGLPGETGVLILDVPASTPFARAGLKNDDVILSLNGSKIDNVGQLILQTPKPGQLVELGISRNQKAITIRVSQ